MEEKNAQDFPCSFQGTRRIQIWQEHYHMYETNVICVHLAALLETAHTFTASFREVVIKFSHNWSRKLFWDNQECQSVISQQKTREELLSL